MKSNNNNEYFSVHITATGTLTDNPKSLAEMESNDALPWRESLICVVYSGPPDGREEDLWNKAVTPTTWLALRCVNHMIDT